MGGFGQAMDKSAEAFTLKGGSAMLT